MRVSTDMLGEVGAMVTRAADGEIMPRWRNLADSDVREKKPGDIVTEADIQAEARLSRELEAAFPGTIAIGEESAARDPSVLAALEGERPVWVMDPVDGTAAFAAGNARFTTILALVHNKRPIAAWVQAPALGGAAHAGEGLGASVNGAPAAIKPPSSLGDAVIVAGGVDYIPSMSAADFRRMSLRTRRFVISIGIGIDYLDFLRGDADVLVFGTSNPWELPAGVLLLGEAGGVVIDGDGNEAPPFGQPMRPLIGAGRRGLAVETLSLRERAPVHSS